MNNKENDKWGGLSLRDKAALMKVYVSSGTSSISQMREHYNTYKHGGPLGNMFDGYGNSTNQVFTNINNSRNTAKPLSNQIAGLNVSGINTPQQVNQLTQIQLMQSPGILAAMQQRLNQPDLLGATKEGTFSTGTDERTSAQRNADYLHPIKGAAERNALAYQNGNSVWNGLLTVGETAVNAAAATLGGGLIKGATTAISKVAPMAGLALKGAGYLVDTNPLNYLTPNNNVQSTARKATGVFTAPNLKGMASKAVQTGSKVASNYLYNLSDFAMGGPLYNEDNPIEGFLGNNYIPAVRYSLGGRVLKRRKSKK